MTAEKTAPKDRVVVFIDGFNLYHAIHDLRPPTVLAKADWDSFRKWRQHLKWLNLKGLSQGFVGNHHEELKEVLYFSAYATWMPDQHKRHQAYVAALESHDVSVVMGRFKPRDKRCLATCKEAYVTHEEKETDVNVALHLTNYAWQNKYDHAIVISGDSDLVPAVECVSKIFPKKKVTIATPPNRGANELIQAARGNRLRIKVPDLLGNLLPDKLKGKAGKEITRPPNYDPIHGVDWSHLY
jgi:uncharacterized LabA/DUF88 family protein